MRDRRLEVNIFIKMGEFAPVQRIQIKNKIEEANDAKIIRSKKRNRWKEMKGERIS